MEKGENSGQYASFTLSDFIADPFFQDWVIRIRKGGRLRFGMIGCNGIRKKRK
jgi:hypothetical protein